MNNWNNYSPAFAGKPYIYDDRLGCRYFETVAERDAFYDSAAWIDQKHWSKNQ